MPKACEKAVDMVGKAWLENNLVFLIVHSFVSGCIGVSGFLPLSSSTKPQLNPSTFQQFLYQLMVGCAQVFNLPTNKTTLNT